MPHHDYDYLIIGAGIIGLSIARSLKKSNPGAKILIIEKEDDIAQHSSGRNSGVLHAGFYYTADSFKANFTVVGNESMRLYCRQNNIPINECGKLVVAKNEYELGQLSELERRGKSNGSNVKIIDEAKARDIEPNVKTFKKALFSPDTATIDPKQVCFSLKEDLLNLDIEFVFQAEYLKRSDRTIHTTSGDYSAKKLINCAGLYADKIAQDFGFGRQYTMIPFKGLYLKYTKNKTDVKINIYPVPNLQNPFLGVHFTKTVDDYIKIGPTAIPAFSRENYEGFKDCKGGGMLTILLYEAKLFFKNSFHFRDLAFEEMRKYSKKYFISLAQDMIQNIDPKGFTEFTTPGIRAQLLDKKEMMLVQDFIIEGDKQTTHILNAVSPAFTCAFPFSDFVVNNYIN